MNDDKDQNEDNRPVDSGPVTDLDGIEIRSERPASFEADETGEETADDAPASDSAGGDGDDESMN
jgi:hypothetical protein